MRRLRNRIEAALDRRYVSHDELRSAIDAAAMHEHDDQRLARLVGRDDPVVLRQKLFEAHRLAIEAAQAIESLLEQEVLTWQAIDDLRAVAVVRREG